MEMEGSGGGSQSQLIHPAVDVDEAALAVTIAKRERKRSRYLSPPYTDTDVQERDKAAAGSHKQQREEGTPHVSASEVLSALRSAALQQGEGMGMDAAALRFLAMYSRSRSRSRSSIFVDDSNAAGGGSQDDGGDKPPSVSAAGVGRKMVNLNAGPGFAATATHGHANPPPVMATVTPPVDNEKKRRNKKRLKTTVIGQHDYVGNPVALVLDFAEGTPLPSREDLFTTFSRFGVVIDSETTISQEKRTARVAFATRAQAEAALRTLGGGAPFAVAGLHDLPPITPLPKLPLTDIRNNLGKMILSLSSKAGAAPQDEANGKTAVDSLRLVGEMQHLLAKVDKALQVQGASATAHRT